MQRLDLFPLTGRAEAGAIIEATVEAHDDAFGLTMLRSRAGLWRLPRLDLAPGERLRLRVRARDVMLATKAPESVSALNVMAGVVADIGRGEGPVVDVRLDCNGEALLAKLTRYSVEQLQLEAGNARVRPGEERRLRPPQPQRPSAGWTARTMTSSTLEGRDGASRRDQASRAGSSCA